MRKKLLSLLLALTMVFSFIPVGFGAIDPKDNVGRRIPAAPYDENRKPVAVLVIPIVESGEVVGYLPAAGIDNSDGTATLKTSGAGGGGVDPVGLKNIAATIINPATEDTLATRASESTLVSVDAELVALNAKDFATETTLGTRATEATLATRATETTLATRATETTLATRASETTLATVAKEATLALVKGVLDGIKTDVNPGVAEHHNGGAVVTPAVVTFSGTSKAILIDNLDVSGDLLVSFDGGTTTKTIAAGQSLSVEANHASVEVSASAGTVPYEMLVTV